MVLPSLMVSSTWMSLSCSGAVFRGLRSKMTRSANFPGSRLPFWSSSKYWYAPLMVTARRASSTESRWSSPRTRPFWVLRFTALWMARIWSGIFTGGVLVEVKEMPLSRADPAGEMRQARWGPSTDS